VEGEHVCINASMISVCVNGALQFSDTCAEGMPCQDGYCTRPIACTPGQSVECDGFEYHWVCLEGGEAQALKPCPNGTMCVLGECRALECTPGAGECLDSATVRHCLPDGSGWGQPTACGVGETCTGGACLSLCEADIKQNTNVGCQYWAVDLDNDKTHHPLFPQNPTPEMFPHSVVISNPGAGPVSVKFSVAVKCASGNACQASQSTCGAKDTVCDQPALAEYELDLGDSTIDAGQSREFKLPVMNVTGSSLTPKAIRVMASRPVVAFQFNPFNSENATSNDGSLLLPQNSLGKLYYVVSLPSRGAIMGFPENNGFLAVAATVPNTTVKVTPTVEVIANPAQGVPQDGTQPASLAAGQEYTFVLQPFDVLNLEQLADGKPIAPGTIPKDLTGTRVEADQPVAVFSGHQVAGVQEALKLQMTDTWDTCCTEHLEEQLMPVETWGAQALCVKSKPRGYEADRFQIVAGDPGVKLSTIPSLDGVDGQTLAKAGDTLRVETTESFALQASGRIQVVQFLMGQGQVQPIGQPGQIGDPSMMLIPPSSQYRDQYVIQTAGGYSENWTTIVRPQGAQVQVDGQVLPDGEFEPLGDGTWEYAYRKVDTGTHLLMGTAPFGLMVYGYGAVTAYGYPEGMKLEQ
jgi:hypothetical protein